MQNVKKVVAVGALALVVSLNASAEFLQPTKIIAGSDITFSPYEYMNQGKPAGFDIEMLAGIAKQLNRQVVSVDTRFPNLIPGLRGKRFDVTNSAMYITPERLKVIDMVPYLKTGQQILSLAQGAYQPKTPDEFCGHKVGTMAGSSFLQHLQNFSDTQCVKQGKPAIQISEFPTDPQTTQALLSHAIDAQITDVAVAQAAVKKLPGKVAVTSTTLLYPVLMGIGVRKDAPDVKAAITDGLNKFRKTSDYQQLFARYHFTAPTEQEIQSLTAE
ncbi:ABC transporter substrate-binding protein [Tatumella sp. TA1]|uniref:ABC transporter substrate-binding protein n=1 Tax=Rosenbergiella collisarenosi TaxID=1544695 RepID=UPI0008F83B00|nr:ABC transporter substrate-binding protein [Rosenbergiella collisarenosi]MBT0720689.1 ABC transporter substrate-binding protein [Rosenbergiella collisarenosi]QGX93143.1 ABC transporter substrate-binding protein [Tatumella sp. TA1]